MNPSDQPIVREVAAIDPANTITQPLPVPPVAAKGDDDLMSAPQTAAPLADVPSTEFSDGRWQQQVGAAKVAWARLSMSELLHSEGIERKLVGLVQQRYACTRAQATREVKTFFSEQASRSSS